MGFEGELRGFFKDLEKNIDILETVDASIVRLINKALHIDAYESYIDVVLNEPEWYGEKAVRAAQWLKDRTEGRR